MSLYKVTIASGNEFYVVANSWEEAANLTYNATIDFHDHRIVNIELLASQHISNNKQYFFDKLDYFIK